MHWNETVQTIVDYVERCLQEHEVAIDQTKIASLAGCSYTFFQKVFSYTQGFSFAEYVRNRKLTLAGYALRSSNKKIVDISYQFGYESPTSFTKAFQLFHGMSPSQSRKSDSPLRIFPKLQVQSSSVCEWSLVKHAKMRFIGVTFELVKDQDPFLQISKVWSDFRMSPMFGVMRGMDNCHQKGLFGFYDDGIYTIMVKSDHEVCPGMVEIMLDEAMWAIFQCLGQMPQGIQTGWKYLYEEWLVKYPFRHAPIQNLEWYSDGNVFDKSYVSQIWIPIEEDE